MLRKCCISAADMNRFCRIWALQTSCREALLNLKVVVLSWHSNVVSMLPIMSLCLLLWVCTCRLQVHLSGVLSILQMVMRSTMLMMLVLVSVTDAANVRKRSPTAFNAAWMTRYCVIVGWFQFRRDSRYNPYRLLCQNLAIAFYRIMEASKLVWFIWVCLNHTFAKEITGTHVQYDVVRDRGKTYRSVWNVHSLKSRYIAFTVSMECTCSFRAGRVICSNLTCCVRTFVMPLVLCHYGAQKLLKQVAK